MAKKINDLNLIGAFLGFVGAANSAVVGFYLLSTILNLSKIDDRSSDFWFSSIATAITTVALTYGSLIVLKGHAKKGGATNLFGGLVLLCVYVYYSFLSQPQLLSWLNPIGIALVAPSLLSGFVSMLSYALSQRLIQKS